MLTPLALAGLVEDKEERFRKYRLSESDIWTIYDRQAGLCPVCAVELDERFVIDHDHETGGVRGFLCGICNTSKVGSNTVLTARRVLAYLEVEQLGVEDPCFVGVSRC